MKRVLALLILLSILVASAQSVILYEGEGFIVYGGDVPNRFIDVMLFVVTRPSCVESVLKKAEDMGLKLFPKPEEVLREIYFDNIQKGTCMGGVVRVYIDRFVEKFISEDEVLSTIEKLFGAKPVLENTSTYYRRPEPTTVYVYTTVAVVHPFRNFFVRYRPLFFVLDAHNATSIWPEILGANETAIKEVVAEMPKYGVVPLVLYSKYVYTFEKHPEGVFSKLYFARIELPKRNQTIVEWPDIGKIQFFATDTLLSYFLRAQPSRNDYYVNYVMDYNVTGEHCSDCGPEVIVNDPLLGTGKVNAVLHVVLGENTRWADGSPVTARDIVAHVVLATRLNLPRREYIASGAYLVREFLVGYTVIDDRHVDFYFSFNLPTALELYYPILAAMVMPILDPAVEYVVVELTGKPELDIKNHDPEEILSAMDDVLSRVDPRWRPGTTRILEWYNKTGDILLTSGAWILESNASTTAITLRYTGRPAKLVHVEHIETPVTPSTGISPYVGLLVALLLGVAVGLIIYGVTKRKMKNK